MRSDGPVRAPCRPRALGGRFRRDQALSDLEGLRCHLRPQRHRHRGQDHRRRGRRAGNTVEALAERDGEARFCRRLRGSGRPSARRRAQGHRAHPGDARSDLRSRRPRSRLRVGWRTSTSRSGPLRDLRQALGSEPRRAPIGLPDRGRGVEARPPRLRPVEGGQARRAVVGFALGNGTAWLAHRVLGDGDQVPRRGLRHPRRGQRPGLPPPRERDRPERGCLGRDRSPGIGCTTGW